ncbi:glucose-6-phosphate isomerase [Novosphingobium umbonatum]|uniref:Glucose-6-phosphate isomerase n=1 Tax=Novosphingobium umbonatum TaxID=1908524 RepID=A0A3S2UQG0_9SPHN|nr:glucose-6-phosphate isomerase [Novosphingobium umbonatum]RVU03543.1 glucose-6-phosphate isomerase [Novosphingobium umbonatum]
MSNQQTVQAIWDRLKALPKPTLAQLFAQDANRLELLSARIELGEDSEGEVEDELAYNLGGIRFDWSKTHLDAAHLAEFEQLAQAMDFDGRRAQLFNGEKINNTEGRAAEHTAMRGVGLDTSVEEAQALHQRMASLVEAIHEGALGEVKHLIHIGIGGSALGPALAIDALTRDGAMVDVHVVANIDGCALEQAILACDPATTLIAVASKTFTTTETMTNALSALNWLRENGVEDPYGRVIALTAAPEKAVEWGVDETRVLPFPESVGGRYSLWSSIGFPVAMAIGFDGFAEFLEGAAVIDQHFAEAEGAANLPLRAAFADQFYTRIMGAQTRACFAYDERLALLPDYLQQLEMESNGKSVTFDGAPVDGPTAPITWGGVGTDAQHAVFQLLHQGTVLVPVDFIASVAAGHDLDPAHHRILLMNCFAQGAALMAGKASEDGARAYPGNRPSATILVDDLNPAALGALIAFHEHRTFANAVLLGINPFDQFGVELGKEIAKSIDNGNATFDPSTTALLAEAGLAD